MQLTSIHKICLIWDVGQKLKQPHLVAFSSCVSCNLVMVTLEQRVTVSPPRDLTPFASFSIHSLPSTIGLWLTSAFQKHIDSYLITCLWNAVVCGFLESFPFWTERNKRSSFSSTAPPHPPPPTPPPPPPPTHPHKCCSCASARNAVSDCRDFTKTALWDDLQVAGSSRRALEITTVTTVPL